MRRAVPLHYTDYGYGIHPVKLAFHHTLYAWIPYFKDFTLSWDLNGPEDSTRFDRQLDSFSFHCGMAPMLFNTLDIRRDDYDFTVGARMIPIWRRAAPLLLNGDYYPLTPFSRGAERWEAAPVRSAGNDAGADPGHTPGCLPRRADHGVPARDRSTFGVRAG